MFCSLLTCTRYLHTHTFTHPLQRRHILEQMEQLEPRVSALEEDLSEEGESEEEEEEEEEERVRISVQNCIDQIHYSLLSSPTVPPSPPQTVPQSIQGPP